MGMYLFALVMTVLNLAAFGVGTGVPLIQACRWRYAVLALIP